MTEAVLPQGMATAVEPIRLLVLARITISPAFRSALEDFGFELIATDSLAGAVRSIVAEAVDAVLVLADAHELLVACEVLRALGPQPVILAAPDLAVDLATALLDQGADAAVPLPVSASELAIRMTAVVRRAGLQSRPSGLVRPISRDLVIDAGVRAVFLRGTRIELTRIEFEILSLLAERPGRVVTNHELLTKVWGEQCADDVHYVRLYIGYLRSKLEDDPRRPRLILTQWGVGYRLAVAQVAAALAMAL